MVKITVTETSDTDNSRLKQNVRQKKARLSNRNNRTLVASDCLTLCWDSQENKHVPQRSPRRHEAVRLTPKKHRQPDFSFKEQEAILRYIVENNAYDNVGGNKLWKAMEEAEVCKDRSSHSMRNHYFKKLEYALDTFSEILTPEEIECLRLRKPVEDSKVIVELLDSSNVENVATVKQKRRKFRRNESFRKPYSEEDDRAIINYISDNNGYELVKGRLFWQHMAQKRLIEGRTWQALKQRYRDHIYPTLDSFDLHDATLKRFNDGWNHRRGLGGRPSTGAIPSSSAAKQRSATVSADEMTNRAGHAEPLKGMKLRDRPKKLALVAAMSDAY